MIDVGEVRAALDASTPGPWEMDTEQSIRVERSNRKWLSYHWSETTFGKHDESALRKVRNANARLIAAAPTIAAAYIEQSANIARLTEERDRLRDALWRFINACDRAPPTQLMAELGIACDKARAALKEG